MNQASTALEETPTRLAVEPRLPTRPARRSGLWCLTDPRLSLAGVTLFGLGVRLWDLGQRSFWFDELAAIGIAALPFRDMLLALSTEANMTLYYWALFVWLRIVDFGADEALIRLPTVVVGTATIPLIYLLGRRLHSPRAGLAAAALLAVNGFHVLMSQEARSYALLAALTILSYLLLDRAVVGGRRRDWALHGLVTALAFYCHFYTAFTILAQGLFVLSRRSRRAIAGLLLSGVVMAVLTAQLVPFFAHKTEGANLSHLQRPDLGDAESFLLSFSGGDAWALALYVGLALVGIGLARTGARRLSYRNWLLLPWFCLPVGLAFGISLLGRPIFNDRYLFATLPALPLLAGIGLARLPRPAAVAAVVAIGGVSIAVLQGNFEVRRLEQWREAVAYATAGAQPDDGWIFISKWGQNGFEYYADWHWGRNPAAPYAHVYEPFNWQEAYRVPKYRGLTSLAELEAFAAGHPRIWLILSHEFDSVIGGDTAAPARDWLTRHGYAASQRQFRGIRVMLYQRRSG